jgi:bifunctional non-homologous end joining protein LigD
MPHKPLTTYKEKRNFKKTPEPGDDETPSKKEHNIFCIQEHHARALHWDFRLEVDGVMPSWALPKGPSTNPNVKRLAVQTEDHPVSYATFEGIIPEGEYGAGTVMVWDYGTYKNIREKNGTLIPMSTCIQEGRIEIFLEGKKLNGIYVLIRLKNSHKNWLFFKKNDEYANSEEEITTKETSSALTGRSIAQIKKDANHT